MTHFTEFELHQWARSGPGAERERLIAHLAACPDCAGAYAEAVRAQSMSPEHVSLDGIDDVRDFVKLGYDMRPR